MQLTQKPAKECFRFGKYQDLAAKGTNNEIPFLFTDFILAKHFLFANNLAMQFYYKQENVSLQTIWQPLLFLWNCA